MLAEAEAALKKLRANPENKHAVDTLENALKHWMEIKRYSAGTGTAGPAGAPKDAHFVDIDAAAGVDFVVVEQPTAALAKAETALKKLRANANDEQAANELENALKQLKLQMANPAKKPAKP